jgi:prepilin-type processing-associated H-X9-DG protein
MAACCPLAKWSIRGLILALAIAAIALVATPARSQDAPEKGALGKIPADALGFCHIKAADVWKTEMFAGVRELFQKAGSPALQAFNKRFAPSLATLDSACLYVTAPDEEKAPTPGLLLSFTETFDPAKVIKALLPNGESTAHFSQKYTADRKLDVAIRALDSKTLLVSRVEGMPVLLSKELGTDGPLKRHFKMASGKMIYAAVNVQALPRDVIDNIPEPFDQLTKANDLTLTGNLGKELTLALRLQFIDETSAKAANTLVREGIAAAHDRLTQQINELEKKVLALPEGKTDKIEAMPDAVTNLFNLAMLRSIAATVKAIPIQQSGNALSTEYTLDPTSPRFALYSSGTLASLMLPTIQKAKDATVRVKSQNNLKQLALAMHSYHEAEGNMPVAIFGKDGKKPILSWRVAMLPYVGQKALYQQFKLDEAWDSENNKKLIANMPDIFIDAEAPPNKEPGQTHYQVFVGKTAGFVMHKDGVQLSDIADGASNTIMIATATNPVTWTKPEDLAYEAGKPLPKLGFSGKPINVAFFDGSVKAINPKVSEQTLRALITRSGGELISEDY